MQNKLERLFSKLLAVILMPSFLLLTFADLSAAVVAQEKKCETLLAEAENKYFEGLLDETIRLVNLCLNQKDNTLAEREKGYKLLGKAYHAKGLLQQAKENIKKLLELIPNWQPNPNVDTPSFQRLAEEVIAEVERQEEQRKEAERPVAPPEPTSSEQTGGGSKTLLLIAGGGGLAAAAIILLAGGGGGGGNAQLPDPPPLPGN